MWASVMKSPNLDRPTREGAYSRQVNLLSLPPPAGMAFELRLSERPAKELALNPESGEEFPRRNEADQVCVLCDLPWRLWLSLVVFHSTSTQLQ